MDGFFSFFKKKVLILFISLTTTSAFCNIINLQLDKKPPHISVYNWCSQKAKELKTKKKEAVLKILGIKNQNEWELNKKRIKPLHAKVMLEAKNKTTLKETAYNYIKESYEQIKKSFYSAIQNPTIQKKLGDTTINDQKYAAIISSKKIGTVELVKTSLKYESAPTSADHNTIYVVPTSIILCDLSDDEIQASLCHELAHILCKHNLDDYCMRQLHIEKKLKNKKQFNEALSQFKKATEIEADIVGLFNNQKTAKSLTTMIEKFKSLNFTTKNDPNHPAPNERVKYLKKISEALQSEQTKHKKIVKSSSKNKTTSDITQPQVEAKAKLSYLVEPPSKTKKQTTIICGSTPKQSRISTIVKGAAIATTLYFFIFR